VFSKEGRNSLSNFNTQFDEGDEDKKNGEFYLSVDRFKVEVCLGWEGILFVVPIFGIEETN